MFITLLNLPSRSCSASSGDILQYLGRLSAGAQYSLTILITYDLALVLLLRSLPDLNFAAASDDADPHGGEEVVGRVGVHVHTAVEHGGGVLADSGRDHRLATWMILDEVGDVVDNTGDGNEATAVLGLINVFVP
jgi:hypothetical protein